MGKTSTLILLYFTPCGRLWKLKDPLFFLAFGGRAFVYLSVNNLLLLIGLACMPAVIQAEALREQALQGVVLVGALIKERTLTSEEMLLHGKFGNTFRHLLYGKAKAQFSHLSALHDKRSVKPNRAVKRNQNLLYTWEQMPFKRVLQQTFK